MEPGAVAAKRASKLTAETAIEIFVARASSSARDGASATLARRYGITMKAVRDVWNLRTWVQDTKPFWTRSDEQKFLRKHLCRACKSRGVSSLAFACRCTEPRSRGRPRSRRVGASLRSDANLFLAPASDLQGQQSMLMTYSMLESVPQPRPAPSSGTSAFAGAPFRRLDGGLRHADHRALFDGQPQLSTTHIIEDPFAYDFMPTSLPAPEADAPALAVTGGAGIPRMLPYDGHEVPFAPYEALFAWEDGPDQPSPLYQGVQDPTFRDRQELWRHPAHLQNYGPVHPTILQNPDEQTSNHFDWP
jgi:hypothetical protein